MNEKTRKIAFYSLVKSMWKNNADGLEGEFPLLEIEEVVKYLLKLNKTERKFQLKGFKACSLMSANIAKKKDNAETIITGIFKSAQHQYRPNYWDTQTDEERLSPKKMSEGEKEKTHFCIKITPQEVCLALEINGNGISINNIISYLTVFNRQRLKTIKQKQNFTINYYKIGIENFLSELNKLKRTQVVEVYFDKALVGSNGLDFSDRTFNLQRNVMLTLKAEKKQSVTETAVDVFNKYNTKDKNSISKVRIKGKDEDNEDAILDTSFIEKIGYACCSLNSNTGEVQSQEMLTYLKTFMEKE